MGPRDNVTLFPTIVVSMASVPAKTKKGSNEARHSDMTIIIFRQVIGMLNLDELFKEFK